MLRDSGDFGICANVRIKLFYCMIVNTSTIYATLSDTNRGQIEGTVAGYVFDHSILQVDQRKNIWIFREFLALVR
jgi:hypothetical protein